MVEDSRGGAGVGGNAETVGVGPHPTVLGAHLVAYSPKFSIPGVSPEVFCHPEGTVAFPARYPRLHQDFAVPYTLFEIVAGAHIFRIRRDADRRIRAIHASRGGGTLVAEVALAPLAPSEEVLVILRWTPESLDLDISAGSTRLHADGRPCDIRLMVGEQGLVYEIGPALAGVRVCEGGLMLVTPPAIELWNETVAAVSVLLTGTSPSPDFGSIVGNSAIAMLVSGYEVYCQRRFVELEREGVHPDVNRFVARFGRKDEKRLIRDGAYGAPVDCHGGVAEGLASRLSFQNYENCKDAYRLGYGLRFVSLGISSHLPGRLKKLILYRHRIVHTSPALILLNQPEVPPEQPEESSVALAQGAMAAFDKYIRALHAATLKLRSVPWHGLPGDAAPREG